MEKFPFRLRSTVLTFPFRSVLEGAIDADHNGMNPSKNA